MNTLHPIMQQALAPYMPRQTPPSWKTMEETLRQWHEQSLNDPEFQWLEMSFEDMADKVNKAMFCAADNAPKWDDIPGFGDVRAQLDALTIRRSA